MKKQVNIKLDLEIYEKLKSRSKQNFLTLTWYILMILSKEFKK